MILDRRAAMPLSWAVARLDDVADVRLGKMLSRKAFREGLVLLEYLRNENVRWGSIDLSDMKSMGFKPDEIDRYRAVTGDLLVCEGGEPGRCAVYLGARPVMYQKALHRVRPNAEAASPHLLRYWLEHLAASGQLAPKIAQTTIQHLPLERIRALDMPLPPRREQDAIVDEIEQQLTRIDAGVASLGRVERELARYRASVLKAACEGRLVPTEAALARAEGREYEHADAMLRRLLEGQVQRDAVLSRTNGPRTVPDGWAWTTLKAIADLKGGLTKGQKRRSGERVRPVPYLRVANVQRGWLDLGVIKEIEATEQEIRDSRLERGDVLFNEGGDRDKLGRGWVWEDQLPLCVHQNHVFRARVLAGVIHPKLLSWYGNSFGQHYFTSEGKQTTNLASINLTKLGALPVPVPPVHEQVRIVAEVDRRFSIADEIAATVDTALARAARLRQAILKRAFEGKLVPQDPSDEPASVLLERIRKEREAAAGERARQPRARVSRGRRARARS